MAWKVAAVAVLLIGIAPLGMGIGQEGDREITSASAGPEITGFVGGWTNQTPAHAPTPRAGATLTFDEGLDRFVLIGGAPSGGSNETWLVDMAPGGNWTRMANSRMVPRFYHTASYDPITRKIVVFGGKLDSALPTLETWHYDSSNDSWERKTPSGPPSARFSHAMVYEPQTRKHIMFGGGPFAGWNNETWAYDATNGTWDRLPTAVAPVARGWHAMFAEPDTGQVFLFGGRDISGPLNDTWAFDPRNVTWNRIQTNATPPALFGHSITLTTEGPILFGGQDSTGKPRNETWTLENSGSNYTWRQTVALRAPTPRLFHAAAPVDKRFLVFGGNTGGDIAGDIWMAEDHGIFWSRLAASANPSARFGHGIAHDQSAGKYVLYGGSSFGGIGSETWIFDNSTRRWEHREIAKGPGTRLNHAMTYLESTQRVMLHGGTGGDNETWFYDTSKDLWRAASPANFPSHRTHHSLVYHPGTNMVVMFGGAGCSRICGETWFYDVARNDWLNMTFAGSPAPRYLAGMAHDQRLDRIVLFGGTTGSTSFWDTWLFDPYNRTWTEAAPAQSPTPRYGHQLVFDPNSGGVLIFGGIDAFGQLDDLWAYDHDSSWWGDVSPMTGPRMRHSAAAAYDEGDRTMLLFGGISGKYWDGETWIYTKGAAPNLPPRIVSTEPPSDALDVPTTPPVIIEFNVEMNVTATAASFFISPAVPGGTATVSKRTLTWIHAAPLEPESDYTIVITSTAKSAAGVNLQEAHVFSFTTGKGGLPRPPFVVETSPADGSTNVEADAEIGVRFSQSMDLLLTVSSLSVAPKVPGRPVGGVPDRVNFTHEGPLAAGTGYIVTISTKATSADGDPMVAPYSYRFTTAPAPRLLSIVPLPNSTHVPADQRLVLEFSEPMRAYSVADAIHSTPGVEWNLSATNGDRKFHAVPSTHLEPGTSYIITIDRNAISHAGFPLAEATTFNITTQPAVVGALPLATMDLIWLGIGALVVFLLLALVFLSRRRTAAPTSGLEKEVEVEEVEVVSRKSKAIRPYPVPQPPAPDPDATRAAAARRAAQSRSRRGS